MNIILKIPICLIDPCDPLTNTLQILFDILEKDKEDSAAPWEREGARNVHTCQSS